MNVTVNGKAEEVETGLTLLAYLAQREVDPAHVVIEHNEQIVDRERFGETTIADGDRVEILRFVGGG